MFAILIFQLVEDAETREADALYGNSCCQMLCCMVQVEM